MKSEQTNQTGELKSELARLCLPAATRDPDRKFVWMNSICFIFLLIGIFGRPEVIFIRPPKSPEEIVPAAVLPVAAPPPTVEKLKPEEIQPKQQEVSQVVVVTPDSPAIHFAVPTIGNLLAPASLAAAPPLLPMRPPAPVAKPKKTTDMLEDTGAGGSRPQPPYPPMALEHGQQGTVVLLLKVDAAGAVTSVEIKQSSGYPFLDRSTLEFVKYHWTVPPGAGTRTFEATIRYKLETE